MSAAGDHHRSPMDIDPIPQLSIDPIDIPDPPKVNLGGENSPHLASRQGTQHGVHGQHANLLPQQSTTKIQEELHELGQKVNHHEHNIQYLESLKTKIEESILEMQVALKASVNDGPSSVMGEEETTKYIISRYEKTAAALLCSLKRQAAAMSSDHSLTENVIGVVATLGKVDNENLSRLLSEYLGEETMLAVVCKTQEGIKALEAYKDDGSIDTSFGIHAFSASIGRPLADRFCVICLEDLCPYAGEFIVDDPQQRFDLPKPRLPNGETPPGFLDFAVNMITIDSNNLSCVSKRVHGLRETLFYNIFSDLQVYRSREDMLNAISCIRNGAISLDGGMMKSPGVFDQCRQKGEVGIKFPTSSTKSNLNESHVETKKLMKEAMWKKDCLLEDIKREQALLANAKFCFEAKKKELFQFLSGSLPHSSQHPAGRASTPR